MSADCRSQAQLAQFFTLSLISHALSFPTNEEL